MSWLVRGLLVLVLLIGGYAIYAKLWVNGQVEQEITANPQGERAQQVLLLTFASGKSIPVNYLQEDGLVYLGADGPWWREFSDGGAPVTLLIKGEKLQGYAVAVLNDHRKTKAIFSKLRPDVPRWLPKALNGVLVEISIR